MPLDTQPIEQMSADQIQAKIKEHQEREHLLQEELKRAQQAAVDEIIDEARDKLAAIGIEADVWIQPKAKGKAQTAKPTPKVRAQYRDNASGMVYKGGRFPAWLNAAMAESGLGYEAYRDQRMTPIQ